MEKIAVTEAEEAENASQKKKDEFSQVEDDKSDNKSDENYNDFVS
jgi:hypothetical protein